MYKSKLLEFCQRHSIELPEYEMKREGPDHNPSFQATVVVDGVTFQSRDDCRSIKLAQNEAARMAYRHFNPRPTGSSPVNNRSDQQRPSEERREIVQGKLMPVVLGVNRIEDSSPANNMPADNISDQQRHLRERGEIVQDPEFGKSVPVVTDNNRTQGTHHLYKNQLQTYTQKQNLPLPVYTSEREGPPHASRFRSKVTVGQQTFESLEFFSTLKEAEHSAAKIALASLVPISSQEEDCVVYKNLLQEMAQRKGFQLPVYSTIRSGASHVPIFCATVEVAGKVFYGNEAKTKKLAEMSAAKVAYMGLKEGIPHQTPPLPPSSQRQEVPNQESPGKSIATGDLQEEHPVSRPKKAVPDVPSQWFEVPEDVRLISGHLLQSGNGPGNPAMNPSIDPNLASPAKSIVSGDLQKEHHVSRPKKAVPDVPEKWVEVPEDVPVLPAHLLRAGNVSGNSATNPITESPAGIGTVASPPDQNANHSPAVNDNNTESPGEKSGNKLIWGKLGGGRFVGGERVVVQPWKPGMILPPGSEMVFRDDKHIAYRLAPQTDQAKDS